MQTQTKNQHYVPRLYLKHFAKKVKGNTYMLWAFNKATGKITHQSIKRSAAKQNFYNYINEKGDKHSIEDLLANIEGLLSNNIKNIYNNPTKLTLLKNKRGLAIFLCLQYVRTTSTLSFLKDVETEVQRIANKSNIMLPIREKNDIQKIFVDFILSYPYENFESLMRKNWFVIRNTYYKSLPFWTSDNPVVFLPTEFLLPISPGVMLAARDSKQYPEGCRGGFADFDFINRANVSQVVNAQNLIFSKKENDFEVATRVLEAVPELKNTRRQRFNINNIDKDSATEFNNIVTEIVEYYRQK